MPTATRLLGPLRRWGWQRPRPVGGPFTDHDGFGRQLPTHMGIGHYLLLCAKLDPTRVRTVPRGGVVEEGVDEESYALVACPCGARPVVRPRLVRCEGCERWYCYVDGRRVFVVYGAMEPPPLPSSPA
jgi:hypothetical protein